MNDPLRQLQQQPWGAATQVAVLVVALATVVEWLLIQSQQVSPAIAQVLMVLFNPPLGILMTLAIAIGLGSFAILMLERLHPWVRLSAGALWTVIACLALVLWVRSLLPLPQLLTALSWETFIGLLIGASWKSWPHWRR